MTPAITFNEFSLRYSLGSQWALSQLTLSIPQGSCVAVLGQTSAGKSTLLQTLVGLLGKHHRAVETQGTLQIAGEEPTTIPRELLFPRVGLALQDPYVMLSGIYESVEEEVAFTLQNVGYAQEKISEKVWKTLATLKLEHVAKRHPLHLSGGETQRVALASILVAEPEILLLDEPLNALDSQGQDAVARIIRSLHTNTTVVFTDYQIDLALAVADHILVLDNGKSLFYGSKLAFLKRFDEFAPILIPHEWNDIIPVLTGTSAKPARTAQRISKVFGLNDAET